MRRRSVFNALSIWLGLVPVVAFAAVGLVVILMSQRALKVEIINQINDDMAVLVMADADGGDSALEAAIIQRIALETDRAGTPYYRLEKADTTVIGNLETVVSNYTGPVDIRQGKTPILARATPLRGQRVLTVGRDMRAMANSLRTLGLAFGIGALALALISIILTRWHIERLRRRTAVLNETFDKIALGHLDSRIISSRNADEIDELGLHINAMLDRLQRLLTLRKRLTDQLAHEIRSPLARLDATLAQAGRAEQSSFETVRADLGRTLLLLDGLLDISALEAQTGDRRNFAEVDLSQLVAEVFDLFEPLAEDNNMTMMLTLEDGIQVSGDISQLGRLVSNLLDNAIKYATGSPIEVVMKREADQAQLTVSNRGPEIGPTLRAEIFTPFFRHPNAPTGKGHGLGLALCRSISARHSGQINVESDAGMTNFSFVMPIIG